MSKSLTHAVTFTKAASTNDFNMMEAVKLTAAEAGRTLTLSLGRNFNTVTVAVFYTYGAATALTVAPSGSIDGTNYASLVTDTVSGGTVTKAVRSDSITTSAANKTLILSYDVRGLANLKLIFAGSGSPTDADLINIQVSAV